jgi:sugar/nucleoside kinase (ribokinase family)
MVTAVDPRQFDLLVVGEINADLILRGPDVVPEFGQVEKVVDSGLLALGSSAVITACGAARLGLRTAFAGVVGDDALGRFMLDGMRERGIDVGGCIVDPSVATGVSVILEDAAAARGRAILTAPGSITALSADQVDRTLLAGARHVHCASYFLQDALRPGAADLLATARRLGATTSLDTNWDPSERWDVGRVLDACDLFLPNEQELLRIAGTAGVEAALARLAPPAMRIAVKRGSAGGSLRSEAGVVSAAAPGVDVVDTTGAGDSFNAGAIYGLLAGLEPARQLALAIACGSLSTLGEGGTSAQPTLAEASALAAEIAAAGEPA